MGVWLIYRDTEQPPEKKFHRTNQGSNFLGSSFSKKERHFKLEKIAKTGISKDDFSSTTDPSIFTSIVPVLLGKSNETSTVFPAVKSTSHFLPQSSFSNIKFELRRQF